MLDRNAAFSCPAALPGRALRCGPPIHTGGSNHCPVHFPRGGAPGLGPVSIRPDPRGGRAG
eukprot:9856271-Lingulodinium_polyedra.AAC.1